MRNCIHCGANISQRHYHAKQCLACYGLWGQSVGAKAAYAEVSRAIKSGSLPKASECACVDCGEPATDYDHRDYSAPLDVAPVCRSCNKLRGPAIPLKAALTTTQLRAQGSAAADAGESIYEAEIRSGLTSAELIEFEAGYFARQFECEGQGVEYVLPVG